jgi:hypothetical protein
MENRDERTTIQYIELTQESLFQALMEVANG